jgi:hypothetical protein
VSNLIAIVHDQSDVARKELQETIADDVRAPSFQRKRDHIWIRRAKG